MASKNSEYVPDSVILDNQRRAAELGVSIPGLAPKKTKVTSANRTINTSVSGGDVAADPFLSNLQSALMKQIGIVSSSDSQIEGSIRNAIQGVRDSAAASAAAIESSYNREIGYTKDIGQREFATAQENQSGYAMQVQALRVLTESTEKDVKDLEQRKQELILQGNADAAAKIAGLQMQALEFKQRSQQNVFNNLIAAGNFGLSLRDQALKQQQLDLSIRSQDFTERSTIASLAAQYGVPIQEGDTIETIAARIAPYASEKQLLEIEKMRADITKAKAETAKALRGDKFTLDPITAKAMASTITRSIESGDVQTADDLIIAITEEYGPNGLNMVKMAQFEQLDEQYSEDNLRIDILDNLKRNDTLGQVTQSIIDNPLMSAEQKQKAQEIANEIYSQQRTAKVGSGLLSDPFALSRSIGQYVVGSAKQTAAAPLQSYIESLRTTTGRTAIPGNPGTGELINLFLQ